MKKYRTLIIVSVVVLVVLAGVLIISRMRANATQTALETATIGRGTLTASIGATGNVRANQSAILTWQTSGMVETVNAATGDKVAADDVLAALDPTSLPQNVLLAQADLVTARRNLETVTNSTVAMAQAELNLYQAQDALDNAEARYDSATETYGEDSTARGYLQVKASLALAQARLEDAQREYDRVKEGPNADDIAAAQARVDAAEAALRVRELRAPFDGTVTETFAVPGTQVTMGTLGFRIDDLSHLLIDVSVTEVDINQIAIDQPVIVTFDAVLGAEYYGRVVDVAQAGEVLAGVVNFTVTVELEDVDGQVKPGMTAAVTITVEELEDVLLVPNRAVRLVEGQRVVYLLRDGIVETINITLGASSDTMSEVIEGDLQVGDVIILNPTVDFMMSGPPGFVGR